MDPLSIVASVTGLLIAGAQISSVLQTFISSSASAPSFAQTIYYELQDFGLVLTQLQGLVLGPAFSSHPRASMIDVDQLIITITGCVCTFSELEKEITELRPQPTRRFGVKGRMRWALAESTLCPLVQRLQNQKLSLSLILGTLTCNSPHEATENMHKLYNVIERLVDSNTEMSRRLRMLESQMATSGARDDDTIRTGASSFRPTFDTDSSSVTGSIRTVTSYRLAFESTLFKTRVYSAALRHASKSFVSLASSSRHTGRWSILSGISLAEVSNISVLSLPISASELYNQQWYPKTTLDMSFSTPISSIPESEETDPSTSVLTVSADKTLLQDESTPDLGGVGSANSRIQSTLLTAVVAGDVEAVQMMLDSGADRKTRDEYGYSPLHLAAIHGHEEVAKVLIAAGVYVDGMSPSRNTALHIAAHHGQSSVTRQLLLGGAGKTIRNGEGYAPMHLAVMHGHDDVVRVFVEFNVSIRTTANSGNESLHMAARSGQTSTVQLLLRLGANIEEINANKCTPLHLAAQAGQVEVVQVLIQAKAILDAISWNGNTPLALAAQKGHKITAELLLKSGAHIESKNKAGYTPLLLAAARGELETVQLLRQWGADTQAKSIDGNTAMHLAVLNKKELVAELLLKLRADISATNAEGHTSIQLAAAMGQDTMMKLTHEQRGGEVLLRAAEAGTTKIVEMLVALEAETEARTPDGRTAMHIAIVNGHSDVLRVLLLKADKEARSNNGSTPLHLAAALGATSMAEMLLQSGADIEARTDDGSTPLHLAAEGGCLELVQLLLETGANLEAKTTNGSTVLALVLWHGHHDILELLESSNMGD